MQETAQTGTEREGTAIVPRPDPLAVAVRLPLTLLGGVVGAVSEALGGVVGDVARRLQSDTRAPLAGAAQPIGSRSSAPAVVHARFLADALEIALDTAPVGPVRLAGPRAVVEGVRGGSDEPTHVRFPLLVARWGADGLALPSGEYRLQVGEDPRPPRLRTAAPAELRHARFHARLLDDAAGVHLQVGPPLAEAERRPVPHRDHRHVYLRGRTTAQDAVYFESFYGRSASDNPLAIDREIARRLPEVTRYWSVADGSVAVPEGAVPIIEGTSEWWRVRAEARVLVINDWLRWTFHRRPHQRVLQTWHGTMLKRLALDRSDVSLRRRSAIVRQQGRWDALLSQNRYSSAIFRRAYAVQCPIWESGYPRNDVLTDPARAAQVRQLVGIPHGAQAVLYAPTWRDDRHEMVDHLDLVALADELPADHVLLVRGHSRTMGFGGDVRGGRLIDVTTYPDMADLMLAADVLVTDYSSSMFDFVGTGKPLVFFTPDLDDFAERLRGFYFDLLHEAPGPVVTTRAGLLDAITSGDGVAGEFADRYTSWQRQFTPHDDGTAGRRVVDRMLDEGWLG